MIFTFFCIQMIYAQGNLYMDNARYLYAKTVSGVDTRILGINNGDNLYLGSVDAPVNNLLVNLNGNNRIAVNGTTGYVGIGHTNPQAKLHVSTGNDGDAILMIEADLDNNNESDNPEILFRQDGGLVTGFIGFEGYANAKSSGTLANAFILGSEDTTNPRPVQIITGDETLMTVSPVGVGIGTENPSSLLHVKSANNNAVRFNHDNTPSISFLPNDGDSHFHISHTLNNRLTISQGGIVGNSELVTIVNNGAVGIGTINPGSYKLAVKGKIRAEEIKVETGWADYVFKEGYNLPTLEEVERHIKEKGHLINIPSASKVKENGVALGEMNKLLLEKIEELTLYTIEQDRQIKSLKLQATKVKVLEEEIAEIKRIFLKP